MAIKNLLGALSRNLKARGLRDVTDSKNWATYLDGTTIEQQGIHIPYSEIMAYAEQLVYRTTACADCVAAGLCAHCGCTMPKAAMVASKTCPEQRWGAMLTAEDWELRKRQEQIRFSVERNDS